MNLVKSHQTLVKGVNVSSSGKEKHYFINGYKLDGTGIVSIKLIDVAGEYPEVMVRYFEEVISDKDKRILGIGLAEEAETRRPSINLLTGHDFKSEENMRDFVRRLLADPKE